MKKVSKHQKAIHMKFPNHVNMMADGGVVKRKNFDGGGLASSVSGLLGTQNNFSPTAAPITAGTNSTQLDNAYQGAQGALTNQNNLATTLAPQAQQGVQNQNFLQNQYTQMAQGQGPNPAQAALNQNTGVNIAQQAALMAGQRGAGANPGLIAMQAAQQGANTQQQAVGQGATLQAQQQIAAQNNLSNLSANQINQAGTAITGQNTAQQNEQNALQGANTSYNNSNVSQQSNLNSVNAGVAQGNQQQNNNLIGGITGGLSAFGGGASSFLGSLAHGGVVHNYADGGPVMTPPPMPVPPAQPSSGGGSGGITSLAPLLAAFSDGGFAEGSVNVNPGGWGGQYTAAGSSQAPGMTSAPQVQGSSVDLSKTIHAPQKQEQPGAQEQAYFSGQVDQAQKTSMAPASPMNDPSENGYAHGGMLDHHALVHNYFNGGGTGGDVPAIVSPKEVYLSPDKVRKVLDEGADPMKIGHHFPGKDKVKGKDSKKNDIIPTSLQDGGVVLPLHVTQHKKASERGRAFVAKAVAKHLKKPQGS